MAALNVKVSDLAIDITYDRLLGCPPDQAVFC